MIVDTYYDLTCGHCARSWSTDFQHDMSDNRKLLIATAHKEGWSESTGHRPICPECKRARRKKRMTSVNQKYLVKNKNNWGL